MPGAGQLGDAILDTILLAVEVIAKSQLQGEYTKWARSLSQGSGGTSALTQPRR